jgi:hypothetical protein
MAILQKTNVPADVVLSEIDISGSVNGFGFAQWVRSVRPELKILPAATPERTVRNAADLCEVGPTLKRPYEHKLVLDRIKRLLNRSGAAGRKVTAPSALGPRKSYCRNGLASEIFNARDAGLLPGRNNRWPFPAHQCDGL